MKLVYIAHGFMLATLDRSAINPRFDKVEAWKYGPVIPSVYHSFKQYGNSPITQKTVIFQDEGMHDGQISVSISTPELYGEEEQKVCRLVWKIYSDYTDGQLVDILHKVGSPWSLFYVEGKNNEIPDIVTKIYYTKLIDSLKKLPSNA